MASETTPVATPDAAASVEPGRRLFCRVLAVGRSTIELDPAELLQGEVAVHAAIDTGVIQAGEDLPNDYLIRNDGVEREPHPLAADVQVRLLRRSGPPHYTSGTAPEPATLERLLEYYEGTGIDAESVRRAHFEVTVQGGQVVSIEEVYFP